MKRMIVVCGVPRSGTSLCCQALERLGVSFGGPLIPADEANPWGYSEHRELMELSIDLFLDGGHPRSWFVPEKLEQPFQWNEKHLFEILDILRLELERTPLFGWKTPLVGRMCWHFRSIFSALEVEPAYVHALRDPVNVYWSTLGVNGGENTPENYSRFFLTWARMVTEIRDLGPAHEIWYDDWTSEYGAQNLLNDLADALQLPRADATGLLKEA
jgi:hypothetical protein